MDELFPLEESPYGAELAPLEERPIQDALPEEWDGLDQDVRTIAEIHCDRTGHAR